MLIPVEIRDSDATMVKQASKTRGKLKNEKRLKPMCMTLWQVHLERPAVGPRYGK